MTGRAVKAPLGSAALSIILVCIAYASFNVTDVMAKMLGDKFHFSQVAIANSAAVVVLIAIYGWVRGGRRSFKVLQPKWVLLRAVLSIFSGTINIIILPYITLTNFYTLVFTAPFWVTILSSIFLGEKMEKKRLLVILGGFAVVLFIFRPGGGMFNIWSLLALISAFCYAAGMTVMRHMGTKESRPMIVIAGAGLTVLALLPLLPFHYVTPTITEYGWFLLMGVSGAIGIMCAAYAFQIAPSASMVAPYHYTQIVWGALLGFFVFGDIPGMNTIIGAALIIMAGLYLLYSESRKKKKISSLAAAQLEAGITKTGT